MTRAEDLDTLGVAHGATETEIRTAYRAQALSHHPDLGGDATAMALISDAYQRLLEPAPSMSTQGAAARTPSQAHLGEPADDFTIGHSVLAFVVVPVIFAIVLMLGVFSVLSTIL